MSHTFEVAHMPFLVAVGTDVMLSVDRSLAFSTTDPRYQPITDHIRDHRMVLVQRSVQADDRIYGRCETSLWATPEARNLLMTNTEETE